MRIKTQFYGSTPGTVEIVRPHPDLDIAHVHVKYAHGNETSYNVFADQGVSPINLLRRACRIVRAHDES